MGKFILGLFWLFRGPQNYTFWLFKSVFWPFLVSRPTGRWELRSRVRSFVRSYVRHAFSRKPLITFYEPLQLVRACEREKIFQSAFLKKFPFCPFWPKTPKLAILAQNAQKWRIFAFFSQSINLNFWIFCTKSSLWSRKNYVFALFGKIQKWPFLAKFG